jgi:hypothetical protein
MNIWLMAATILLLRLIPCGVVCLAVPVMDRLVALQLAGGVNTLILLLLAEGFQRPSYTKTAPWVRLRVIDPMGRIRLAKGFPSWLPAELPPIATD